MPATPVVRSTRSICAPWRRLIRWFGARPELKDSAFIRIGEYDAPP